MHTCGHYSTNYDTHQNTGVAQRVKGSAQGHHTTKCNRVRTETEHTLPEHFAVI